MSQIGNGESNGCSCSQINSEMLSKIELELLSQIESE